MKNKYRIPLSIIAIILSLTLFVSPQGKVFAETADGTYSVSYQVLSAGNDSVSIANDYFVKPATLFVENGVKHIQFTVKESQWVKALGVSNGGSVSVVSENKNANTRVVKFKVTDLSQPIEMDMHISFKLEDMDYDQKHKARFDFDVNSMKKIASKSEPKTSEKKSDDSVAATGEKTEENPPTGDNTPIAIFVVLLAVSSFVLFRSVKSIRSSK